MQARQKNQTISAIVLTQNEADNIKRCLNSLLWCDEILLIDDSTDATVNIAKEVVPAKKLRVIHLPQNDDFALLRNRGLKAATSEWALFIDADEEVTKELADEIVAAIDAEHGDGYFVRRRDYFLGKWLNHGETGNTKLLKLGRRLKGIWERRVHEIWKIEGNVGELTQPLYHYPHPTIKEFISRINRWTTLDAQEFYKIGIRSSAWKVIVYPKAKFFLNYFIRFGFLDGMPGLIMALCMSFHSFLTRAKLYLLEKK